MGKLQDLTGRKTGLLTVGERAPNKGKQMHYYAHCECGRTVSMEAYKLRTHPDPDCGCRRKQKIGDANRKHGYFGTKTYESWAGMFQRATACYAHVSVCDRWSKFENFLADMGERPAGKTLDRIDNEGDYEPGNCRWATPAEQARNRCYCIRLQEAGTGRIMTAAEWSRERGIPYTTLYRHVHAGKPPQGLTICH